MATKLLVGQRFPSMHADSIHGEALAVPSAETKYTHVQFRRFAGCPICNLHLQSFVARHAEIESADITEVVVFHSSVDELLPFQGRFPFHVVGDPEKRLYRQCGVESRLSAILSPGAWPAMLKGTLVKNKPKVTFPPTGGPVGLPADFLIAADGTIMAAHYGKHADDQWSVDEMLALVRAENLTGRLV
jgi:peroxiredoxin